MRHDAEIERAPYVSPGNMRTGGSAVKMYPRRKAMWPGRGRPVLTLSHHPSGETRATKLASRAGIGDVELTENEGQGLQRVRSIGCMLP